MQKRLDAERAAEREAAQKKPEKNPKKPAVAKEPIFQPIEGPALPISTDKKQRLDELLRQYQADQITPSQYHEQRAKILAGQ